MDAFRLLRPLPLLIEALGFVLLIWTDPAAAETARRLKIDLEVRRDGAVRLGADQGKGKLVQQLTLTAVLHSDGTPMAAAADEPERRRRRPHAGADRRGPGRGDDALALRADVIRQLLPIHSMGKAH